ncbi:NUDIX hydrolase [Chitinophaga niabensis]|uniref:ADP-ribose pyrophosphatase YjhB, NUDIX family n=1 Tax=Chitinophaga niabensis TaxID=536979 RepID=A0A1N6FT00_9BACT|nr:NUDIX domain-containing protein [Chitinophaga niabensis]SIN98321.1 ADP-ribose pyrophosphatase YjhB, NUDIX family [Chitinophaga niabensis]
METPVNIYINERPIVIAGTQTKLDPKYLGAPTLFSPTEKEIEQTVTLLDQDELPMAVFRHSAPETVFANVKAQFTVYEAAGGVITNPDNEVLLMFRRGKWDLPKGKWDDGETLEECALREVREETGLHTVKLGHKITETFHYYPLKQKKILKHSHWYRMYFTGTELTVAQIEEDILDIQWIRPENLGKYMQYSYQNIIDVLLKAGYKL